MANISFSANALAAFKSNIERIFQPNATTGGSRLVDQSLCDLFKQNPNGLEVELLRFDCSEMPTNRQRNLTTSAGDKLTVINAESMQQRGTATIIVNGVEYTVPMHAPVALSFVDKPKQVLLGSTGEISTGTNQGKQWLSLRLPTSPSHAQMLAWAEKATTAEPATVAGG